MAPKKSDKGKKRQPRGVDNVPCPFCNHVQKYRESLPLHTRNTCRSSLVAHRRKEATRRLTADVGTSAPFACPRCAVTTANKDAIKKHVIEHHVDMRGRDDRDPGYDRAYVPADSEYPMPGVIVPPANQATTTTGGGGGSKAGGAGAGRQSGVSAVGEEGSGEEEDDEEEEEEEAANPLDPLLRDFPGGKGGRRDPDEDDESGGAGAGLAVGGGGLAPYVSVQ